MKTLKQKTLLLVIICCLLVLSCVGFISMQGVGAVEKSTAPLYSVSSSSSSVRYGKHSTYAQDKEGIIVSLAQGDKFYFNKAIDLTGKTARNTIISMFPTPTSIGVSDAHFLALTLTDAYDPTNYLTITAWDPWQDGWGAGHCYVYTYAAGRNSAGKSALSGNIEKNNTFGTECKVSFSGQREVAETPQPVGQREIKYAIDYAERQVFSSGYTASQSFVADYDDTDFYDELWYGFTTGEVFLSIEAGNYKTANFNFMITSIADNDISVNEFAPNKNPELKIDSSMFEKSEPIAIVGEKFKFLPYDAFSIYDAKLITTAQVTLNGAQVTCDSDGFIPQTAGEYTIKYISTDKYGNKTEQSVKVNAIERENAISLVLFDEKTEFKAGVTDKLAKYYSYGGTVAGLTDLAITANLVGSDISVEIDPKTLEFTPQNAGEYVIRYDYSDYLGKHSLLTSVRVSANDDVFLYSESLLPDYFIKGAKYVLDRDLGCTFENGFKEDIKAEISVIENGQQRVLDGNVYEVEGDGSVTVTFTVKNGEKQKSYSKEVKIIDVGYNDKLAVQNYFDVVSGNVVGGTDAETMFFDFSNSGELRFINNVQGESFSTSFSVNNDKIGGINVILTDSENAAQRIKFTFTLKDGKTQFILNDSTAVYNVSEYNLASGGTAEFTYDNQSQTIKISKTQTIKVKNTVNGKEFNGFSSSLVKVSYQVFGVQEQTRFTVYKLNNQAFYDLSIDGDSTRPELITNYMRGERVYGEKVVIKPMLISDVLDPYIECTINVKKPDGTTFVKDVNGVELKNITDYTSEYTYVLDEYGDFLTSLLIFDGARNRLAATYKNTVIDKKAPELIVNGAVVQTAKVGDSVAIPTAKAEDIDENNKKTEVKVYIWLESPDGKIYDVTENGSFKPQITGRYTLTYNVVDQAGNMSCKIFYISVVDKEA